LEACIAARLDPYKWEETTFYTHAFKARIMAWYRLHNLILAHVEDARYLASLRKAKRKK